MKPQSWLYSWPVDITFFFFLPLAASLYFYFHFNHYNFFSNEQIFATFLWVGAIDWGHFASLWPRIFLNPAENTKNKLNYTLFFFLLVAGFMLICNFLGQDKNPIYIALAYMALFHTIKQQFGFFRIYSRFDSKKSRLESLNEQILIYTSMLTPIFYWHVHNTDPMGVWFKQFIMNSKWMWACYISGSLYLFSFLVYLKFEYGRTKASSFNIAKNLCLALTMLSWGIVSFLPRNALVLAFSVQLHHNISYISIVWLMGRRDQISIKGKLPAFSLHSLQGLLIYIPVVIILGQLIFTIHRELSYDLNKDYFLLGHSLNWIPKAEGWWMNLGWGVFFSTQLHHFITDRFLWKKEKDYSYILATSKKNNG